MTGLSSSCSSPDRAAGVCVAVIACGALAADVRVIAARRGWPLDVHGLPATWHNDPRRIAPAVERLAERLRAAGARVAVAYADCGSYGELDRVCERLGLLRLPGLHCYDVLAGPDRIAKLLAAEPGTYLLTDFLVRGFRRCVLEPLGLDRHPELWPEYFRHYRRVVWLAQSAEPGLAERADEIARMFGLPLAVIEVGTARLERELERLVAGPASPAGAGTAHPAGVDTARPDGAIP